MRRFGRTTMNSVVVATIVAMTSLLTPSGSVSACSCEEQFPTVMDSVGQVDIAFVGRLETTEEIDPTEFEGSPEYFDTRYELIVEHAVKGVENGDRVVMFGDVSGGSSCGTSELEGGRERYAILSSDNSGVFVADSTPPCTELPSVNELLDADLTLPGTSPGPVSLVVVGRVGEAELISYGADGRPVGYGDLPWRAGRPAVCPGNRRLVQLEQTDAGESTSLAIRDLATLDVIERIDLVSADRLTATPGQRDSFIVESGVLECRSSDGRVIAALISSADAVGNVTKLVTLRPDGVVVSSWLGRLGRATYDPFSDDVVGVRDGYLVRIDTIDWRSQTEPIPLSDGPDDTAVGAVFVEPDDNGGWWIGLGPMDNDDGNAVDLQVLVHVDDDGIVERWPVEGPVDFIEGLVLDGDRLVAFGVAIALPTPGSSTTGSSVIADETNDDAFAFALDDGRSVRPVWDDGFSRVELVGTDGVATKLEHLLELRSAIAVLDGPTADSDQPDRQLTVSAVESQWVTSNGQPAVDHELAEAALPEDSGPAETGGDGVATDESTAAEVSTTPGVGGGANAGWDVRSGLLVAAVVAVIAAVGVLLWRRRQMA